MFLPFTLQKWLFAVHVENGSPSGTFLASFWLHFGALGHHWAHVGSLLATFWLSFGGAAPYQTGSFGGSKSTKCEGVIEKSLFLARVDCFGFGFGNRSSKER